LGLAVRGGKARKVKISITKATLLVNNVELAVGDAFPIGWNFLTGDREYAHVTAELLQEARCLSATLECELTSQAA
jgi:hypothetical protein